VRRRFRFEHSDAEYGVFGQFGPEHAFSVVPLAAGAERTPGSPTMQILAVVRGVDSAEQLRHEVEKAFPDLTGFRHF
jgi:hypothetical protein